MEREKGEMGRGRKILKRNDLKDREKRKRKGTQILKRNNSKDGEKWKRRGAEDPKRNDLKDGGKAKRKGPKILKRKEHRVRKRAFVLFFIFFVILSLFFVVLSILCGNKLRSRTLQFIKLSIHSTVFSIFFLHWFLLQFAHNQAFVVFSTVKKNRVSVFFSRCSLFQSEISSSRAPEKKDFQRDSEAGTLVCSLQEIREFGAS